MPELGEHLARQVQVVWSWLRQIAAPWLIDRRLRVTHGSLLAIGVFAVGMAFAGIGNGTAERDPLHFLLPPADATTDGSGNTAANIGTPQPAATPSRQPAAFSSHVVESGDTLYSISERYGVSVDYLLWNNPNLTADPDLLIIGNELLVPGIEGIVYDVRLGDTINGIAATYDIDPQSIIEYDLNDLDSPDTIVEGLVLVLPGAVPPPPPEPVLAEPAPAPEPEAEPVAPVQVDPPAPTGPLPAAVVAPLPEPEPVIVPSFGFIWPVSGSLNSLYGPRWGSFHKGIDIGAPHGTGIAASGSGQVILATYRNNGYGNYVIIRHSDGSETLYAHLSSIGVSLGQYVNQGDYVGAVGCTGWCTGNHLHFEIHVGGSPVDPLIYLP
ncbi:MAG TPA: peptidoglycan DD-metalloendopeptidase family protein [Dehalococcoidia bacterium]|nr:peptidoglycan DD-metalloendopeptidase family protein [Dehalococcoidia bacterium]